MIRIISLTPRRVLEPVYKNRRSKLGAHSLEYFSEVDPRGAKALLQTADFIVGDWTHETRLNRQALERTVRCQLVAQPSAGYDTIDVMAAKELGIPVANAPGANATSVAEWTVMAVLMSLKNAIKNHERLQDGQWWMTRALDEGVFDLAGRSVGILGFGAIGRGVAKRLTAFGVERVLYYDPFVSVDSLECGFPLEKEEKVRDICRESDIVCVHSPLTPETVGLVGSKELQALGEEGVLVNASRGGVVDEGDLRAALSSGTIKAAALDVFKEEPLSANHDWKNVPNLFVSPHISGGTREARDRMISAALDHVEVALAGGLPESVVNGVNRPRMVEQRP